VLTFLDPLVRAVRCHGDALAVVDGDVRLTFRQLDAFPNVDLSIHLHRPPRGAWVGLDTTVTFGPEGHGVTSTVLHDEDGAVGVAAQMLTIRPLDAPFASTSEAPTAG
jgi:hypothetical protein